MSASTPTKKIAVIVGCGSKHDKDGILEDYSPSVRFGLGGALSLQFAVAGYHVLLLSRRLALLELVRAEVDKACGEGSSTTQVCDVTDDYSVRAAFDVAKTLGKLEVVVFNAAPGFPLGPDGVPLAFGSFPAPAEVDPAQLTAAFDVGVSGAVRCAREAIPVMVAQGSGSFLVSGATMSLRGGATFACMSPVKFGLRSFCQSMSQAYHPKGVHVAHVIIDGVIDSPKTRPWGAKTQLMDPLALADAYVSLAEQARQTPSVWQHEVQLSSPQSSLGMRL